MKSLLAVVGLGAMLAAGACDDIDEAEAEDSFRSAPVHGQLTGQQCRKPRRWIPYKCYSYDLTLEHDGTFVDSNAWEGTFEELDDGTLELDFGDQGITVLRETEPVNDKCWEPDPDAPLSGGGIIHVCKVSQPFLRVKNYVDIVKWSGYYILPAADEVDHWAAAALTPPVDMQVRSILYRLKNHYAPEQWGTPNLCWAALPHHVQVFISEDAPDATPEVIEEFFVELDEASLPEYSDVEVELPLSVPLVVPEGTRVYVSVEMVNTPDAMICVQTARDMLLPDTNYWSNSATTPYPWATLESFFRWPAPYTRNYAFDLLGIPLGPDTPAPPH